MSPAAATDSKTAKPEPATMQDRMDAKLREELSEYRKHVARAAAGKRMEPHQLAAVASSLESLGLPGRCWEADVAAVQQNDRLRESEQQLTEAEAGNADRAHKLLGRIKETEKLLAELRGEHHQITQVDPLQKIGIMRRQNELRSLHPHVLDSLDAAVAFRRKQTRTATGGMPGEGWQ
jgi:hypothetical protein